MATLTSEVKRLADVKAPAGFAERVLAQVGAADSYAVFETVLGKVYVAWNRLGVSAAMRSKTASEFEEGFRRDIRRPLMRVEPPPELAAKIEDQLEGKRRMRFDLRGLTPFSQAVLHKTMQIPRGQVRPYGWVAREIGHPAAVRAVGTALANNPIPYFIPCHRVALGRVIGNYGGGGPEAKKNIPRWRACSRAPQRLAQSGTGTRREEHEDLLLPDLLPRTARARGELRVLPDEADARSAGYRPCKDRRPAWRGGWPRRGSGPTRAAARGAGRR
jgi:methylated-DNA-[protein]-cysteine S-methyltransferase